ncbi:MAG: ABC transporter ATP-binding protein [Clostridiales bacterium]
MLEIKSLKKTYIQSKENAFIALNNVNLKVGKGEFISVMGSSGSGKTTLLNCISGFISSDSGDIILDQNSILNIDDDTLADIRQTKLGFVFQDFMLIDGLTVMENIHLPQIITGQNVKLINEKTEILLKTFGIYDLKNKYTNEISGGQKQRTSIARALANNPLILLADEPTGNLDSKSSGNVIEAFLEARNKLGATIFMVTHDTFAASHSDRIVVLKDGQIVNELLRTGSQREFLNEILTFMKSW